MKLSIIYKSFSFISAYTYMFENTFQISIVSTGESGGGGDPGVFASTQVNDFSSLLAPSGLKCFVLFKEFLLILLSFPFC